MVSDYWSWFTGQGSSSKKSAATNIDFSKTSYYVKASLILSILSIGSAVPAYAQMWSPGSSTGPTMTAPVVPAAPPPQAVQAAPTGPQFFIPPTLPTQGAFIAPLVPTDVTNIRMDFQDRENASKAPVNGVALVPTDLFPKDDDLKGSGEWIVVRGTDPKGYQRLSPHTIQLSNGSILVSVRRPSSVAIVNTPLGEIAINADSDVLLTYTDGVVRINNLTGLGKNVLIKTAESSVSARINGKEVTEPVASTPVTMAFACGYEVSIGEDKLSHEHMRPADGLARRHFQVINDGKMAVCQFSVESALNNHDLIAELASKQSGAKERKILGDMSKMAAVLNHMHGTYGYKTSKQP